MKRDLKREQSNSCRINVEEAFESGELDKWIGDRTLDSIEELDRWVVIVSKEGVDFKGRLPWRKVRGIGTRVLIPCLLWAGAPNLVALAKKLL